MGALCASVLRLLASFKGHAHPRGPPSLPRVCLAARGSCSRGRAGGWNQGLPHTEVVSTIKRDGGLKRKRLGAPQGHEVKL